MRVTLVKMLIPVSLLVRRVFPKMTPRLHYVYAVASVKQNRSKIDVKQNGPKDAKQIDRKPNKMATQTFEFIIFNPKHIKLALF